MKATNGEIMSTQPTSTRQAMSYQTNHYSDVTVRILKPSSSQTELGTPQLVFEKIVVKSNSKSINSWGPIKPAKPEQPATVKKTSKPSDFSVGSIPRLLSAYVPLSPTLLQTSSLVTDRQPLKALSQKLIQTPSRPSFVEHVDGIQSTVVQQENVEPALSSANVEPAEKTQEVFGGFQRDKITSKKDAPSPIFPLQFLFDEEIEQLASSEEPCLVET